MRYVIVYILMIASTLFSFTRVGEVGSKINFATNEWRTLNFQGSYTNPVVVIGAPSYNGAEQCVVRVRNVQSNSCEVRLQETTNLNGIHSLESIYYIIMEKGDWTLKGGLKVQAGNTNFSNTVGTRVGNSFADISFFSAFDSPPKIISTVMTFNDTNFVKTRHNGTTTLSASIALEEDENSTHIHGTETIGWIAMSAKIGTILSNTCEISSTPDSVDNNFYSQSFSQSFSTNPIVLAQMRSYDGPNNAETRISNITSSNFSVKIEEDTTYDSEVNHTTEVVDYFAFEKSSFLYVLDANSFSIKKGNSSPSGYLYPYASGQGVFQLKIVMGDESVTNFRIQFSTKGSGDDSQSTIPVISLYSDVNGDGQIDGTDGLMETTSLSNDNGKFIFSFGDLPQSSTNIFLITYDVGGAYNGDTYALFFYDTNVMAYGTNTGQNLEMLESSVVSYTLTVQTPVGIGIGEVGVLSDWVNESWSTIKLRKKYTNPVIIGMPVSYNESEPVTTRLRNVTSSNFQIRLQEPPNENDVHSRETVSYIVLEEGEFALPGGSTIVAGKYNTSTTAGSFDTVNYGYTFSSTPTVLHQVMTYNDSAFVHTRARNSATSSFQVALQEAEGAPAGHGTETIGWLAIETGSGTNNGIHYEAGRTSDSVNNKWYTINFISSFISPTIFLSSLETYDGADPARVRYNSLSASSAVVKVEEDTNNDSEQNHTTERVDYIVFESTGDLVGTTNVPSANLFVKASNMVTNIYWEENQGPCKIWRLIAHNTNHIGNTMEVDSVTMGVQDKSGNGIIPSSAIKKIEVVHFQSNRPILVETNIATIGTNTTIDLTPSPIYISNVSFATSEIFIYVASNAIATNVVFTIDSSNNIVSHDSFYGTSITNHPMPGFSFPTKTSGVDLVSYFYISHDTLADVGTWELVHIEILNHNHSVMTNFVETLFFDALFGTTNTINWTNYTGNGSFSNIPNSAKCSYSFAPQDKGILDLYIKDTTTETLTIVAYDNWMSDRSNYLRIGSPKLKITKVAFISNSSTYTQISLNNTNLVPGSKITYQISCSNFGLTAARSLEITDSINSNSIYLSNSLFLNGNLLTDIVDGDEGDYGGTLANHIFVFVTNLNPTETAIIRFSVVLK